MAFRKAFLILASIMLLATSLVAQLFDLNAKLPIDENVLVGKLDNGLTYYIRRNTEPQNFAELRLVINAGSIDEDDHQRGLAHFTEHMAFNGTRNFPGNSLNEYLNSMGLGMMGGDLNAATSFDFTFYMLPVRPKDKQQLDKAFVILSDWAAYVNFDHTEIDKERGIIMEEWRLYLGAQERMQQKYFSVLFKDSKYANRAPIGTPEVLESFPYQVIKDFYKDWYRPDLQAVVAVGDFDVKEIEDLIKKHFNPIPKKQNPRVRPVYEVPEHDETRFVFATDKEATHTVLYLFHKHPKELVETVADYRHETTVLLLDTMLNNRFEEMTRRPEPPFMQAFGTKTSFIGPIGVYLLGAVVDDNGVMTGYNALMTEMERVKQHGFHKSELVRAKEVLLKNSEQALNEKDKTDSKRLVWTYMRNFMQGEYMMNIEHEHELLKYVLGTITLFDVQNVITKYLTEENRVIALTGPEERSVPLPTEKEILAMFQQIENSELEEFPETKIDKPLLEKLPKVVKVDIPREDVKMGYYTWTLKNGAKVHLKTTNFRNDEILFSAVRRGGTSLADDKNFLSVSVASDIQSEAGLGSYDATQLSNYLSVKDASLTAELYGRTERLSGRSSVKDFDTLMQLLYLNFTAQRFDPQAFKTWKHKSEIELRNVANEPQFIWSQEVSRTLYNNHLRTRHLSISDISKVNHKVAFNYFKSRFESANDFNFYFVGNIDKDEMQKFIEQYIAPLPNKKTKAKDIDRNIRFSQKGVSKEVRKGQDERSMVMLLFANNYTYNLQENMRLEAMNSVLNNLLFENIREKMSGVYVVQAIEQTSNNEKPEVLVQVVLGCSPERVDELIVAIHDQLNTIKNNEFDDKYIDTFKETFRQRIDRDLRTNKFWLSRLVNLHLDNLNPDEVLSVEIIAESITRDDVTNMAKKYINFDNMLRVVLLPEVVEN